MARKEHWLLCWGFEEDWLELKTKDAQDIDRCYVVGASDYAISHRVSYEYDLGGPSIASRTGCSSSLVGSSG